MSKSNRIYIVGAGQFGRVIAKEIDENHTKARVIAFLDDDQNLIGTLVDGIRDLVRSRGLGDVYKRQGTRCRKPVTVAGDQRLCPGGIDSSRGKHKTWIEALKIGLMS